jgi:hypothetical protein
VVWRWDHRGRIASSSARRVNRAYAGIANRVGTIHVLEHSQWDGTGGTGPPLAPCACEGHFKTFGERRRNPPPGLSFAPPSVRQPISGRLLYQSVSMGVSFSHCALQLSEDANTQLSRSSSNRERGPGEVRAGDCRALEAAYGMKEAWMMLSAVQGRALVTSHSALLGRCHFPHDCSLVSTLGNLFAVVVHVP